MTKADSLCGLKSFSIGGRFTSVRERCLGMTDAERQWRAQFVKDQILSEEEPKFVLEYYKSTTNVFRRLWKTPALKFEQALASSIGKEPGVLIRNFIGKTFFIISLGLVVCYWGKNYSNDWTKCSTIEMFSSRPRMLPSDPGYPNFYEKTIHDYVDQGFYSSSFAKVIEKPPPPPPPAVKLSEDGKPIC